MSHAGTPTAGDQQQPTMIPSLVTSSLRVVLDAFGTDILALRAHGSNETTNSSMVEDLRRYGLRREQETNHRLVLDYEQLVGANGDPDNLLDTPTCDRLLDEVDAHLGTDQQSVKPDLTVTALTIRVTEPTLKAVTPAQSTEFDLTFVADPAESPAREITRRRNADRGLYSDLGFNITNLNLRSVVETEAKFHEQSDGRYLSWGGPTDIRPRAPTRLAVRISQRILPDDYGLLKPYTIADDSTLELATDDLESFTDRATAEAGDA